MKHILTIGLALLLFSCDSKNQNRNESVQLPINSFENIDTATFAGGCFWCIEASFEQIKGVKAAVSGYAGGKASTADYRKVSAGSTDHAETVQIYFDPTEISYEKLLEIFFTAHDPTQLNRQGPDVGRQYRSAIFYHSPEQLATAKAKIAELQPTFRSDIVTQLNEYKSFYPAEDYHQDYEEHHPFDPYIMNVSRPKIDRVKTKFKDLIKEDYK